MDRNDNKVELGQNRIRKIERTITENVALNAGEQSEPIECFVQFADSLHLRAQFRLVQSVSLNRAPAMFRDSEILQPKFPGSISHFFEGIMPVTCGGMTVKGAS